MRKVLLFVSGSRCSWDSMNALTPGMAAAYGQAFGPRNLEILQVPTSAADVRATAARIRRNSPERIFFLSSESGMFRLLKALGEVYRERVLPELSFHVFGDFNLKSREWDSVEHVLKRTKVTWICASTRQASEMSSYLRGGRESLRVCPFPVNPSRFRFDAPLRSRWRKSLGLMSDEMAVVYAGRMSLQKNVIQLIQAFGGFLNESGIAARLYLAGNFDEIGAPVHGIRGLPGFYFQAFNRALTAMRPEIRERIHYLGAMGAKELPGLYNAADVFASLSLNHSEIFGMAPAEALCCGAAAVLTDWGGYADFEPVANRIAKSLCRLVPVRSTELGLALGDAEFPEHLTDAWKARPDRFERRRRSELFQERYSVSRIAAILQEIGQSQSVAFSGFRPRVRRLSSWSVAEPGTRAMPIADYRKVYGGYLRGSEADNAEWN